MLTPPFPFRLGIKLAALVSLAAACSSSTPSKRAIDAGAAEDVRADEPEPEVARPDVALADLPLDAVLVGKDTAALDSFPQRDAIVADLVAAAEASAPDLPLLPDSPPADAAMADRPDSGADLIRACLMESTKPACNDNPNAEAIMGDCQSDGTCACRTGYVLNPSTGRCGYRPPTTDAAATNDALSAASCTGEYDACGCGCCGGVAQGTACYYPTLGETIADIRAKDDASKSPGTCNLSGCSSGVRYLCCMPAAPEPASSATYTADWYLGDLDHLGFFKDGSDCALVSFVRPMKAPPDSPFRIDVPPNWGTVTGSTGCGDAGPFAPAKGALGSLVLRASGTQCTADLHVTLFTVTDTREVKATRLDVDNLVIPNIGAGMCK
jgi:hypothetical protein